MDDMTILNPDCVERVNTATTLEWDPDFFFCAQSGSFGRHFEVCHEEPKQAFNAPNR
eukprot:CAMPEP_0202910018 /NCGR_PEP_ID=MMETSP1392-20130828/50914_1 /ASSEMBLY_ACC=CAM_ASM_000868 /TAXON_ID=225041 /ORGANISM="Chlamydomonas chlamydogama, Strain SAG 11-48b" /LENGTH=56 /DNA_ID=CAMNT_0049599979 /DNA_START=145 /DNA_END=315 /DNA_ORIENTATION=-